MAALFAAASAFSSEPITAADPFEPHGRRDGSLKDALDALRADRYREALARRNGLADPLDRLIVDTFLVRAGTRHLTSAMLADIAARSEGWPGAELLQQRLEEAIAREAPAPDVLLAALQQRPVTAVGTRLVANALMLTGRGAEATERVRAVWLGDPLGTVLQAGYLEDFGTRLSEGDHLARVDMLVAQDRFEEVRALRRELGAEARVYVDARVAVATGSADASQRLADVPRGLRRRSGYLLAEIEAARRANEVDRATRLFDGAPRGTQVDGDAWWTEARIVARMMAERGEGRAAYALVARGLATSVGARADEAFHAGWFALRYLADGGRAEVHLAELAAISTTPLSLSRAAYWRGRAASLRGDEAAAQAHHREASRHGTTYYGQLSRVALGLSGTGVGRPPAATAKDRLALALSKVATAAARLVAAGHGHRAAPLLDHLARTVPTPGQAVLVATLAERAGGMRPALSVAKAAQRTGLDVGRLAHPIGAIPDGVRLPDGVDLALVYAVARQESEFNAAAVSPAGARGLMQLMPGTAAAVARELRMAHSAAKLTSDPAHNATLGAAYLAKRLDAFDGSYVLTLAAYNAGAARASEWIARFGDPRDPKVDPVMWVEDIPFPETRNYVQRVIETVQVYREALGTGRFAIHADLSRGRAG
ncbi:transglycosylase SLT domain-containing protein [Acuticoccus sp.]|uniref:lytic transglycosylase domain-containing protein n=1 Tax=Acuticoccus sp. TaxID=1904378 RepID=UPI003B52CB3B